MDEDKYMTCQCQWCNKLKSDKVGSFKSWFTYRYKGHENDTEPKMVMVCPVCVNMISIIVNTIVELKEKQKDVTSVQ
jgi:hypothetical protein